MNVPKLLPVSVTPTAYVFGDLPALSIHQPWAHSILYGGKDIENRKRRTNYRGRVLIHASLGMVDKDVNAFRTLTNLHSIPTDWLGTENLMELQRGGIVGEVEIVACVRESNSPWFEGPWGYVLKNPRPLPFTPCRGQLGFFRPQRTAPRSKDLNPLPPHTRGKHGVAMGQHVPPSGDSDMRGGSTTASSFTQQFFQF